MPGWYIIVQLANKKISNITQYFSAWGVVYGSILGLMATTPNAGLFWPYSLMLMGMNSNRTEDVMTGQLPGFFLSCIIFLAIFLLTADVVLAKQDVKA